MRDKFHWLGWFSNVLFLGSTGTPRERFTSQKWGNYLRSINFSICPHFLLARYHEQVSEVLTSVQRTEESLRKFKKIRDPSGSDFKQNTDDYKIRLQLQIDIKCYIDVVILFSTLVLECTQSGLIWDVPTRLCNPWKFIIFNIDIAFCACVHRQKILVSMSYVITAPNESEHLMSNHFRVHPVPNLSIAGSRK